MKCFAQTGCKYTWPSNGTVCKLAKGKYAKSNCMKQPNCIYIQPVKPSKGTVCKNLNAELKLNLTANISQPLCESQPNCQYTAAKEKTTCKLSPIAGDWYYCEEMQQNCKYSFPKPVCVQQCVAAYKRVLIRPYLRLPTGL